MRYFRTLIISLGIHLGLGLLLWILAPQAPSSSLKRSHLNVIEFLESPEERRRPLQLPKDQQQFTRATQIPDELLTKEKRERRFSSENEQTVVEETKAAQSGLTANRAQNENKPASGPTEKTQKKQLARTKKNPPSPDHNRKPNPKVHPEEINFGPGDIYAQELHRGEDQSDAEDSSRPWQMPSFGGAELGASTVGEHLPDDIKIGQLTALNADRHLYYTFYARMEEQIRPRWVSYARAIVFGSQRLPAPAGGGNSWITRIEVVLDRRGNFIKAILHEGSGFQSLDAAPVQAFRDAKQFPNPPQEMVKEDGTIRLHYAFNVNVVARWAGAGE